MRVPDVAVPTGGGARAAGVGRREGARAPVDPTRSMRSPRASSSLFGSERFGVPRDLVEAADDVIGIPIYGVNNSLPVTVAAGIVMHEWARRRYAGGAVV